LTAHGKRVVDRSHTCYLCDSLLGCGPLHVISHGAAQGHHTLSNVRRNLLALQLRIGRKRCSDSGLYLSVRLRWGCSLSLGDIRVEAESSYEQARLQSGCERLAGPG
jgi:hypothetical protein